jgi:hypothetical protein
MDWNQAKPCSTDNDCNAGRICDPAAGHCVPGERDAGFDAGTDAGVAKDASTDASDISDASDASYPDAGDAGTDGGYDAGPVYRDLCPAGSPSSDGGFTVCGKVVGSIGAMSGDAGFSVKGSIVNGISRTPASCDAGFTVR